jgi:tetratricopeptide (TPR) repeat protein
VTHELTENVAAQSLSAAVESGEVVLKDFRTDSAQGYDAVGEPVDRARAAQRAGPPGTVLVGPGTARLTEGLLVTEPVDRAADSGRPGDPAAQGGWCTLTSVAPSTTWEARARRGLTPFVGRDRELSTLLRLVDAVKGGGGRVAGVVGDPGVGKSRLVYELTRAVPAVWAVRTVAANPLDLAVPFRPLIGPVAELSDPGRTPSRAGRPDVEPALSSLLETADSPPAGPEWDRLDPGVRRRRTISAIADLLIDQAAEQPLLLVVEDAHWLDGESLAVLDTLVDRISSAQVLLVVTYRPEHDPGWGNRPQFELVRLEPLSAVESSELAASLLGDHPSVGPVRRQLVTWTGGVPLFLEESVRELLEATRLNGAPGQYVVDLDAPPLRLSARIHGVLAARIDRLPPAEKRLLQAAAVIGFEGDLSVLAAVLGVDPDRVDRDLPGLQRADLLYERRSQGRRHYVFKHALVLDTAYASLGRVQRRLMHARVMDALADDQPAYGGEAVERLAYHATQAERWAESLELNRRAGERALHRCAYREAGALLTQALEAQRRLPPDVDREIALLIQLRPALHAVSDFDRALEHLVRAEELAANAGPNDRLVHILLNRAYLLVTRGHLQEGVPVAERALDLAQHEGDPVLVAESRLAIGQGLVFGGDPAGAVRALRPDMAVRMGAPLDERLGMAGTRAVFAHAWMAIATAMLGDFADAEEHVAQADRLGLLVDRPIDTAVGALGRGVLELQRERPEDALPALELAQARCVDAGMSLIARWVTPVLAEALTEIGEYERAEGWLLDVLRAGESARVPLWETAGHIGLARVTLALGEADVAIEHATRAGEVAARWGYPAISVTALHLLARAAAAVGDHERASSVAAEALAEAERVGLRPEAARIRRLQLTLATP